MKNLMKIALMLFAVVAFTACNNAPKEEVITEEAATEVNASDDATVEVEAVEETEVNATDANIEEDATTAEAAVEPANANQLSTEKEATPKKAVKESKEVIAEQHFLKQNKKSFKYTLKDFFYALNINRI